MVLFSFAAWRFALYLWRAGATPAVCGLLMAGLPCCATTEALYVSPAVLGGTLEFGWKERHFVWCRDLFIPRACDEHKTTSLEVASVVQGQADFSEPPHTPGVRLRNFLHQRYDVAAQSPYLGLKSRAHCHGLGRGAEGGGGGGGGGGARPGPGLPGDDVLQVLVPQGDSGLPSDGPSRDCALCRNTEGCPHSGCGAHSHHRHTLGCRGQEGRREGLGCAGHGILKSASMKTGSAPVSLAMASRSR